MTNPKKPNPKVEAAIQTLLTECNTMGNPNIATPIADALLAEHRTIQQSFLKEFAAALYIYSELATTDLRNEAAVSFAKKVADLNHHFPYI